MTINIFGFDLGGVWPPFGGRSREVRRLRRYERRAAGVHADMRGAKLSRAERLTGTQLLEAFRDCHTGAGARRRLKRLQLAAPYDELLLKYWMYGENIPESAPRQSGPSRETRRHRKAEENGPKDGGHFLPLSL